MDTAFSEQLRSITHFTVNHLSGAWLLFFGIMLFGWLASRLATRMLTPLYRHLPPILSNVVQKGISILILGAAAVQALHSVGVDIISILGAAGVAGIAIGFASQTALSNLISGLFVIGERSLKPGDYIHTGTTEGTVESINLLSVTLRQPDNSLLRLPCETLIKTPFSNESATDKRRCTITVGVEYGTELETLEAVAFRVVKDSDFLLNTPGPALRFGAFDDNSVTLHICAWCDAPHYYDVRYRFAKALYNAFREAGISFAYPVRTIIQKHE